MTDGTDRDAGFDDWLDALDAGEGFYLACPEAHGTLPPARICRTCGRTDLDERPLPETGTVGSYTVVHVPTTRFAEDAPYVTAIADFGPVDLTGILRGVERDEDAIGLAVTAGVERTETGEDRVLVFRRSS